MKILVVEDDELIAAVLSEMLTAHHYVVEHATDGKMGLNLAQAFTYDLIVLDLSVPLLDGLSVCRKLRQQGLLTPILVLTARDSEVDKAQGLDAGADDYVCKPFNALELLARIRALIRRSQTVSTPSLSWEYLVMHPLRGEVTYAESPLALTPKEFALLELFLRHPQRIFSRSAILDQLWPDENPPSESAVTMHVKDLRQKLKAAGLTHEVIETIYGMGYRLKTPPPTPKASETAPLSSAPSVTIETPRSRSTPVTNPHPPLAIPSLAHLVTRFQPHFRQQIEWLVTLQSQLGTYAPDAPLWQQVRQAVHKLAGTLGTFGYSRGSSLAKEIEQILCQSKNLDTTQQQRITDLLSALQQTLAEPPPLAAPTLLPTALATGKRILVIDRDPTFLTAMQTIAPDWQLRVTIADNLTGLQQALAQTLPDVVLLDFTLLAESGADLSVSQPLLQALVKQAPPLPVVVLSHQDSLEDRVTVARLGGCRFLPRPTTIEAVLQVLLEVLQQKQPIEAKIMAVDDDPVLLASLDSLLKPWGLRLTPLMEPRQFWQVLTQLVPDLLILDLEMPAFSGIDLCQVVRQDPHWGDLPILVLTSHTDSTTIQQVFAAGADDFVGKPVLGPELVTRILNRLERVCLRQRLSR